MIRFMRFRPTAVLIRRLGTAMPSRAKPASLLTANHLITPFTPLQPDLNTRLYAAALGKRFFLVKQRPDEVEYSANYALSRERPRALRALITARPPRVRIRARNP